MSLTSNDHCTQKSNTVFLYRISTDDISITAAFVCIISSDDIITLPIQFKLYIAINAAFYPYHPMIIVKKCPILYFPAANPLKTLA